AQKNRACSIPSFSSALSSFSPIRHTRAGSVHFVHFRFFANGLPHFFVSDIRLDLYDPSDFDLMVGSLESRRPEAEVCATLPEAASSMFRVQIAIFDSNPLTLAARFLRGTSNCPGRSCSH